jgi:hypothetical protein
MHWGRRLCAIILWQALDRHRCFDWGFQSSQQKGWVGLWGCIGGVGQLCSWRPMTVVVHDWTSTSIIIIIITMGYLRSEKTTRWT